MTDHSTTAALPPAALPVPTGWSAGFLPGADVLMMPLPGRQRTTPSFTVRRWAGDGEQRTRLGIQDPRQGTGGDLGPGRDWAVGRDRWSGGHWFGLRFLRLVTGPDAKALAETRWLLWSATRRVSAGFDLMTAEPDLDATALCAVADLALLEKTLDSMAAAIPAAWSPARSGTTPGPEQLRVDPSPADGPGCTARHPGEPDGPWKGTSLVEVSADAVDALRVLPPGRPWDREKDPWGRAAVGAGLAEASDGTLTERASLAAAVLQESEQEATLSVLDPQGARTVLTLHRTGGLTAAVVPASESTALFGVYPAERSAELVLRGACLGPSDSRVLQEDRVSLALLHRRTLDPQAALPAHLQEDPRWPEIWAEPWSLWTLRSTGPSTAGTANDDHGALMGLNAGQRGNYLLLRDGGGPDGQADDAEQQIIRLMPVQTSSLFITLLTRLAPARPGR